MSRREVAVELVIACLLLAGAAMLYLEWWRSGELELLTRRADGLERRVDELARKRATRSATPRTKRQEES